MCRAVRGSREGNIAGKVRIAERGLLFAAGREDSMALRLRLRSSG